MPIRSNISSRQPKRKNGLIRFPYLPLLVALPLGVSFSALLAMSDVWAQSERPRPISELSTESQTSRSPQDLLLRAVEKGDLEAVRTALSLGANALGRVGGGSTPVDVAVELKKYDIAELLVAERRRQRDGVDYVENTASGDMIGRSDVISPEERTEMSRLARQSIRSSGQSDGAAANLDADMLILEVRLRSFLLSEEMSGFIRGSSLMLPLGQLSRALDFAINVEPVSERAGGWFIRENNLFSLNLSRREVIFGGVTKPIDRGQFIIRDNDIFVDVRALSAWFPIDIEYDISNLLVKLTSREPLPVEERLAREQLRARMGGAQTVKQFPRRDTPYQSIRVPMLDTSAELLVERRGGNIKQSQNFSGLATGEVAGLSAETFVSGNNSDPLAVARLNLGRVNPDAKLFGPLNATQFSIGDIVTPQIPLVSKVVTGRGAFVTNRAVDSPTEFDRITLDGNLLTGWEVELYRNEVLLDFQASRPDGRYVFADVPLLYGLNLLRLVFYGPQGQQREEVRQVRVGSDQVRPGETTYRVAASQHEEPLIGGVVSANKDTQGDGRLFAELERGISSNLSVAGSFASLPIDKRPSAVDGEERTNYANVSVRGYLDGVAGRLDLIRQIDSGWASTTAAQTSIFGTNVIVDYNRFKEFLSEEIANPNDPLVDRTNLRLEGILNPPVLPRIPFNIRLRNERRESGDYATSIGNRISFAADGLSVTTDSTYRLNRLNGETGGDSTGNISVGGIVDRFRIRGSVAYTQTPNQTIDGASVTGDWRIDETYGAKLGLASLFNPEKASVLTGGLNAYFPGYQVGTEVFASDSGDFGIRFGINASFGRNPITGKPFMSGRPIAGAGAFASKVFLDKNGNGLFDDGEEPLRNVSLALDGNENRTVKTDENGLLLLTDLTPNVPVNLGVAQGTLEDPYWLSGREGVQIVPRPGVIEAVNFPIILSGEIDGTIYQKRDAWAGPVSEVQIQLVDDKGVVVQTARSAYDGFYILEFIRPGNYVLRVDPDQLHRLGIAAPQEKIIAVEGGTIFRDQNFVLSSDQTGQTYRAKLATFITRQAAEEAWVDLSKKLPDFLDGVRKSIDEDETETEGMKTFRVYAEGFSSRETAERLCINIRFELGDFWCNSMNIETR